MDARIKIFWRKTRWLWFGFVAASVLCLGVFLLLNFSLKDAHGPFEGAHMPYTLDVPLTRSETDQLAIAASDVRLEVAMVNNINALQIGLYGSGYSDQRVDVNVREGRCDIRYAPRSGDSPETLTLRVLIPQNDLQSVQIEGNELDLDLARLRSRQVEIVNQSGLLSLNKIKANALKVETNNAPIRLENSFITQARISEGQGDITLRQNDCRLMQVDSEEGNVFVYNDTWRGQWDISTENGSIQGITKRLPYNVMIEAISEQGQVQVGYETRYWKKADLVERNEQFYLGSTGNNPANALNFQTGRGDISVEKRSRYTDTDPFSNKTAK